MKKFQRDITWKTPGALDAIARALAANELVVGTSDTILGFLAAVTISAKKLLDETKGRQEKPYLVLVDAVDAVRQFVDDEQFERIKPLLTACWPGPLTIIVQAKKTVPSFICSAQRTVGLRLPRHDGLQALLAKTGPLFSTSANRAGEPVPHRFEDLDPHIVECVAYLVHDDDKRPSEDQKPSTIIDCVGPTIKIIREGAYSREQLLTFGVQ